MRQAKRGKTVDEIIKERIDWMMTPVRKPTARCGLDRKLGERRQPPAALPPAPRVGKKIASEVTKHDIATLSNDIVAGSSARNRSQVRGIMRKAVSGLFSWAAEAGRDYVTASPCVNLPKLDPEHARTRVLSEDEIRIFWHGLDRCDLPWDRRTRLALKFELTTMLRSGELLAAHRDELCDLDGVNPRFDYAAEAGRSAVIQQPLSNLAVEIIKEALISDKQQFVFASPLGDQPMNRKWCANRAARHKVMAR